MKTGFHNLGLFSITAFLALLAFSVGSRDIDVGTDTPRYVRAYERTVECLCFGDREFGFEIFSLFLAKVGASPTIFLIILSLISFLLLLIFSHKMSDQLVAERLVSGDSRLAVIAFLVGLALLSPLTLSTQINGIRQGISAFSLAIAFLEFSRNRHFSSLPFILIAVSFHYSSFVYIVVVLLLLIPIYYTTIGLYFTIILIGFIIYGTGFTKEFISLAIPELYNFISSYGASVSFRLKYGIRFDFAIFTLSLMFFCLILIYMIRINRKFIKKFYSYTISTSVPFIMLGWGFYSNRLLFTTWILLVFFGGTAMAINLAKYKLLKFASIIMLIVGFSVFIYMFRTS